MLPCTVRLVRLKMDLPVKNDSARPSNICKQENTRKGNEETHLDIISEDQDIDVDDIKDECSSAGFNVVNVFVDESETLQASEEQSILSNNDPLAAPNTVSQRKEKTEKKIIDFCKSCCNRSTKPKKCLSVLEQCPRNCYLKFTPDDMKRNFDSYWHNSTLSSRYKFIYEMTEIIPTKYRFIKRNDPKYQQYRSIFYLSTKNGRGTVCKICFHRIIGEQDHIIDAILDAKLEEMNKSARHIPFHSWSPLPPCEDNCHLKLTEYDQRQNLFAYREAETYEQKASFIQNKITITLPSETLDSTVAVNPKDVYFTSFVLNSKTGVKSVCHQCFRTVIDETETFIQSVLHSKWLACVAKSALDKSDADKSAVDKLAVNKTAVDKLAVNKSVVDKSAVDKSAVCKLAVDKLAVNKTVVDKSAVDKSAVDKSAVYTLSVDKLAVNKTAVDKSDVEKSAVDISAVDISAVNNSAVDKSFVNKLAVDKSAVNKSAVAKSTAVKSAVRQMVVAKSAVPFYTDNLNNKSTLNLPSPTWVETAQVENHIKKFPICEGYHYPGHSFETYLPMGLNLGTLYKLYKSAVYKPVCFSLYQHIFQRTNLKFRPPFLGQCKKCESSISKFRPGDHEKKLELHNLLASHIAEVEGANNSKYRDELAADSSNGALMVCYFGYQQSLPTPCLKEPLAFYKRPLWTYNFIIQQRSAQKIHGGNTRFYMWNESQGGKTANEMASCLYSYLKNLDSTVRSVIFCSSSACRESRSKTVSLMFSYFMVSDKRLVTVEHKFLPAGHFQIKGLNFYNGEKYRGKIEEPQDWYQAFKQPVESSETAQVWVMTAKRFYNFENLWKKFSSEGEPLIDKKVKRLLYTRNGVVCYADDWSTEDGFAVYKFPGELYSNLKTVKLENLVNVPLTETKKQDLLGLVSLLSSSKAKSFYLDLCRMKNPYEETVVVKEKVDLNKENRKDKDEEDSEPPQKMQKKISCETDFNQFP